MNKNINPLCKSHVVQLNMFKSVSECVISTFAETDSSIGEAVSAPFSSPLYPNPLAEVAVEEEAARRVVPECPRARSQSSDEKELVDVVGREPVGLKSGAESEGFTFVDALKSANSIGTSNPDTVIDTFRMPTCKKCIMQ